MEGSLRGLSIQVLSVVEERVRKAFIASSPPVRAPTEQYHLQTGPKFNISADQQNNTIDRMSEYKLSSSPILTTANDELPIYTMDEVSYHEMFDDCWVIIYDRVYDITSFLTQHPGGEDVLLEYAGRDCTLAFRGAGHSKAAEASLEPYLIGILPEKERLWSKFLDIRVERR